MLRSVERQSALIVRARPYSGEVNRGSGKFGEREHAQEEQYFRQKVVPLPSLHDQLDRA